MSSDDTDGLRLLRSCGCDVAAGEYVADVFDAARLTPAVDCLQLDVDPVRRLHRLAALRGPGPGRRTAGLRALRAVAARAGGRRRALAAPRRVVRRPRPARAPAGRRRAVGRRGPARRTRLPRPRHDAAPGRRSVAHRLTRRPLRRPEVTAGRGRARRFLGRAGTARESARRETAPMDTAALAELAEVARLVDGDEDLTDILQRLVGHAVSLVPGCSAAALTVSVPGGGLTAAVSDERVTACHDVQFREGGTGPARECLVHNEPRRVDDVDAETRWPEFQATARAHGLASCLALPLRTDQLPSGRPQPLRRPDRRLRRHHRGRGAPLRGSGRSRTGQRSPVPGEQRTGRAPAPRTHHARHRRAGARAVDEPAPTQQRAGPGPAAHGVPAEPPQDHRGGHRGPRRARPRTGLSGHAVERDTAPGAHEADAGGRLVTHVTCGRGYAGSLAGSGMLESRWRRVLIAEHRCDRLAGPTVRAAGRPRTSRWS